MSFDSSSELNEEVIYFASIIYWCITNFLLELNTECVIKPGQPKVEDSFRDIRLFDNIKFPYGYPIEFFGYIVNNFLIKHRKCTGEVETEEKLKICMYSDIPQFCHFGIQQFSSVPVGVPEGLNMTCPNLFMPDLNPYPKTVSPPRTRQMIEIISREEAAKLGENAPEWENKTKQFFVDCGDCKNMFSVGSLYFCDYGQFLNQFTYKVDEERKQMTWWDRSQKNIFTLYIYYFCTITWPMLVEKNQRARDIQMLKLHPICPNPCSRRLSPCSRIANTLVPLNNPTILNSISESSCIRIGDKIFEGEFECLCKEGYTWQKNSKTCVTPDICMQNENARTADPNVLPLCFPNGTLRCIATRPNLHQNTRPGATLDVGIRLSQLYACVCRSGYMGQHCDRPRDSCIESGISGMVSGEVACRTYLGNKCTPHNGTNYYFCKCAENWVHDPAYPFPNCYKRRTICDRVICRNRGRCVGSADQRAFLCICEYGWHGRFCEKPDVRHWLPWGSWTLCSAPLCAGRGWHSRSRACRIPVSNTTGLGQCEGNTVEYRPCRTGCPDPVASYVPMIKLIIFFACCLLILQAAVGLVYLLLQMEYL